GRRAPEAQQESSEAEQGRASPPSPAATSNTSFRRYRRIATLNETDVLEMEPRKRATENRIQRGGWMRRRGRSWYRHRSQMALGLSPLVRRRIPTCPGACTVR